MKKLENSSVLITGGAGFIGSNLVEALLKQNNRVVVLDNFSTGRMENLVPFVGDRNFRLIVGDIRNIEDCRKAVDGIDYVLHEAALGSVPRSVRDPLTTTEVNVLGFVNMLFAAQEAEVKRFVYAASSATYGDSKTLPKVENQIGKPLSPYAVTKYADELFAANFHDLYGVDTIGLRYFNVFGPHQDPNGAYASVIPKFIASLLRHESPVINGDGSYSRDFTYVANVVQANQLALLEDTAEAVNQVYNIACGERTTLNELFDLIKEDLIKHDPEIAKIEAKHGPTRVGDIPHSHASIEKAQIIGYNPQYNVKQGLTQTIDWFYNNTRSCLAANAAKR